MSNRIGKSNTTKFTEIARQGKQPSFELPGPKLGLPCLGVSFPLDSPPLIVKKFPFVPEYSGITTERQELDISEECRMPRKVVELPLPCGGRVSFLKFGNAECEGWLHTDSLRKGGHSLWDSLAFCSGLHHRTV